MTRKDDRREPGFSDSPRNDDGNARKTPGFQTSQSELPPPPEFSEEDPSCLIIKVAALAIVVACAIFIGDRLYQRYVDYRVVQELKGLAEQWEAEAQSSLEQMQQQSREQQEAQRRQRSQTSTGRWLAKNCADWRKSHRETPVATSEAEMNRHCSLHEQYLRTGIAPAGVPR